MTEIDQPNVIAVIFAFVAKGCWVHIYDLYLVEEFGRYILPSLSCSHFSAWIFSISLSSTLNFILEWHSFLLKVFGVISHGKCSQRQDQRYKGRFFWRLYMLHCDTIFFMACLPVNLSQKRCLATELQILHSYKCMKNLIKRWHVCIGLGAYFEGDNKDLYRPTYNNWRGSVFL